MIIGNGKCPKCDKDITHLEIKNATWGEKVRGPIYPAILGCCPHCNAVVSASVEPEYVARQAAEYTAELILGKDELERVLKKKQRRF